jgi:2-amino-4-hydroxy-6-hydroxymethyldihydropteridine diphosphokinase
MATCLIALGSNLGDRAATITTALAEIAALPQTRLVRHSQQYAFPSIGGPPGQPDFLNAAAVIDTSLAPLALFEQFVQIETRHGRRRGGRWSARTLDIDLLLYEDQVVETPSLVVPHPRMSFRHFVLRPTVEIAPWMVHPIIGSAIFKLAFQIQHGRDFAPIVSPSHADRRELSELATTRFGATIVEPPSWHAWYDKPKNDPWPRQLTTWLALAPSLHGNEEVGWPINPEIARISPAAKLPRLTILVDPPPDAPSVESSLDWTTLRQQRGRGPTLWIRTTDRAAAACELSAAIESVWPHLGRHGDTGVQ